MCRKTDSVRKPSDDLARAGKCDQGEDAAARLSAPIAARSTISRSRWVRVLVLRSASRLRRHSAEFPLGPLGTRRDAVSASKEDVFAEGGDRSRHGLSGRAAAAVTLIGAQHWHDARSDPRWARCRRRAPIETAPNLTRLCSRSTLDSAGIGKEMRARILAVFHQMPCTPRADGSTSAPLGGIRRDARRGEFDPSIWTEARRLGWAGGSPRPEVFLARSRAAAGWQGGQTKPCPTIRARSMHARQRVTAHEAGSWAVGMSRQSTAGEPSARTPASAGPYPIRSAPFGGQSGQPPVSAAAIPSSHGHRSSR